MFCMYCGKSLPSDAVSCPDCGREAQASRDTASAGTASPRPPKIDCGFVLAILPFAFGNPLGIVPLAYAFQAWQRFRDGDYEGARRAAHTGKVWSWTMIGLSALALILTLRVLPDLLTLVFGEQP